MARYVDIDKSIGKLESSCVRCIDYLNCTSCHIDKAIKELKSIPTADVVEVVRCEKCKYRKTHTCAITGTKTSFCTYGVRYIAVKPDHYCGYGERKETE